ncbi:MAG: C39 family peptidase [Alphaproteobacteria bacterium]
MKTSLRYGVALAVLAFAAWGAGAPSTARAGDIYYSGDVGGTNYRINRVSSLQELKFKRTIRQQYDFSCGSAAVATLLTHHYNMPVDETEVFKEMWEAGDQEKIRKEGFSMLDMQKFLERRGLRSNGFRSDVDRLLKAKVPAITLLNVNGYMHFVVIKGIEGSRILMSDPSTGTKVMNREEFENSWNHILFVVLDEAGTAQASFNRAEDWAALPKAPVQLARELQPSLSGFMLNLRPTNQF